MIINGNTFIFDGIPSYGEQTLPLNLGGENPHVDFGEGLRFLFADAQPDDRLFGETESVTIFNPSTNRRYVIDENREGSPMTREVEILSKKAVPRSEAQRIGRWLFRNESYKKLSCEANNLLYNSELTWKFEPIVGYVLDIDATLEGEKNPLLTLNVTRDDDVYVHHFEIIVFFDIPQDNDLIVFRKDFVIEVGSETIKVPIPGSVVNRLSVGSHLLNVMANPYKSSAGNATPNGYNPSWNEYRVWLTSPFINCKFTNPTQRIFGDGLHGWRCTMETDCGYAHRPRQTIQSASGFPDSVLVETDFGGYTWPDVSFDFTPPADGSPGQITIVNESDDKQRSTTFVGLTEQATISMLGGIKFVKEDGVENVNDNFIGRKFIRLMAGLNAFDVTTNGTISNVSISLEPLEFMDGVTM
jgi:hypothetical protein